MGIAPRKNKLKQQFRPPWRNKIRFLGLDRVSKTFGGNGAPERFAFELRVLRHLNAQHCPFIPELVCWDEAAMVIVTAHCGSKLPRHHFTKEQVKDLFQRLESYGVRHDDPDIRNLILRESDQQIFLIDFEFATFLEEE